MKEENRPEAVCPRCGRVYYDVPAFSREDNETLICPECGTREAVFCQELFLKKRNIGVFFD